jgi:hypothetical protein
VHLVKINIVVLMSGLLIQITGVGSSINNKV